MRKSRISGYCVAAVLSALLAGAVAATQAQAKSRWVDDFQVVYPNATRLHTCGVCHKNFNVNSSRNAYGVDFLGAGGKSNPRGALAAIETQDSDGDGASNIDEINNANGFMPGYTCDNYTATTNAPADLAEFVDPSNPGCSTASCSQPVSTGAAPTASDCLFILKAAVGSETCLPECVCAPTGSLPISATDALLCLGNAVGTSTTLNCPCG